MASTAKEKIWLFWETWTKENIYDERKGDAIAYFFLYIIIPIIITIISLNTLDTNNISIIYCYMTILISASNSIYDGCNRWKAKTQLIKNRKLFVVLLSNTIVAIYCLYVIMYILIGQETSCRFDWIFLVYFLTIFVSACDIVACFMPDMYKHEYVKEGDETK